MGQGLTQLLCIQGGLEGWLDNPEIRTVRGVENPRGGCLAGYTRRVPWLTAKHGGPISLELDKAWLVCDEVGG